MMAALCILVLTCYRGRCLGARYDPRGRVTFARHRTPLAPNAIYNRTTTAGICGGGEKETASISKSPSGLAGSNIIKLYMAILLSAFIEYFIAHHRSWRS